MCRECQLNSVYELTNKRKFCKKCFCRYFEKKVLCTIRKYSMLKDAKRVLVICTNAKGAVIFNILKKISSRNNLQIEKAKTVGRVKKQDKIALEQSLDDEAFSFIAVFSAKNPKFDFIGPQVTQKSGKSVLKFIKPLYFCLDKEISLYANINKIKGNAKSAEKDQLKSKMIDFINFMEKKHPEIKNAVVNSMLEVLPLLK